MKKLTRILWGLSLLVFVQTAFAYQNFKVSVYCTRADVERLSDENYFHKSLNELRKYLTIDKVYLEVHRRISNDEQTMRKVKKMFEREGIATAGGITATGGHGSTLHFSVLCYSDEQQVSMLFDAVKIAAKVFDECILDDFFFTSCRCDHCIQAKGKLSWTDYRLKKMTEISRRMVKLAKKINPKIKMVIKYPNWYPYYQNTGYNLATQPEIFDGIYTGTETRDPVYTQQNLQPYQSYAIMRYLSNVAPGKNGGGWVDPLARGTLDRYAQQLALTVFGGAREVTLFHWDGLFRHLPQGRLVSEMGAVAGETFRTVDVFAGQLQHPQGLVVYRPVNTQGENFVEDYLGMLGLPLELTCRFPAKAKSVLLTAAAAADPNLLSEIKMFLKNGGKVIMTSGLLKRMQDRGMDEFLSARVDGYATVNRASNLNFTDVFDLSRAITIPIVQAPTNDCWGEILGVSQGGNAYPFLVAGSYSDGQIFVLTVPDDFSDFYALPRQTLLQIKRQILDDRDVVLDAPTGVSLFAYQNHTLILQSFLRHNTRVALRFKKAVRLIDVLSGKVWTGHKRDGETVFDLGLRANRFQVLRYEGLEQ